MNNIKGVIFDLDGTLADTMGIWDQIDIDFLSKRGITVPDDYMQEIAHLGAYKTALYTIDRFNLTDTPEELIAEWTKMALESYKTASLKKGAREYLCALREKGCKISIASATDISLIEAFLKSNGIRSFIDYVITVDDIGRGKEHPDIYIKCAELMNVKISECLVYEDILVAVKGALSGGFKVIAMYDKYSRHDHEGIKSLVSDFIVEFPTKI